MPRQSYPPLPPTMLADNFIVVDNCLEFGIDQAESGIKFHLSTHRAETYWSLTVAGLENPVYEAISDQLFDEGNIDNQLPESRGPIMVLSFVERASRGWRDLAGIAFEMRYDISTMFPILPDNMANVFFGEHMVPNNHQVAIGARSGNKFVFDWSCDARCYLEDDPRSFHARGEVPFLGVNLMYDGAFDDLIAAERAGLKPDRDSFLDERIDLGDATTRLALCCDLHDFHAPTRQPGGCIVEFACRTAVQ